MGVHLRNILDAEQEPFVLQDVIWEKKHPVRIRSSRELKFEDNDPQFSPKKVRKITRKKPRESRQRTGESSANGNPGSSPFVPSPPETMVAFSSATSSKQTRKRSPSSSSSSLKPASTCKSPLRGPNKKALLMEAAARILEGSNRRACRSPSFPECSVLRDLDRFNHSEEQNKDSLLRESFSEAALVSGYKCLVRDESDSDERLAEGNNVSCSNIVNSLSSREQHHQLPPNNVENGSGMTDREVVMVMQSRINPLDELLYATREVVPTGIIVDKHYESQQESSSLVSDRSSTVDMAKELGSSSMGVNLKSINGSICTFSYENSHEEERDAVDENSGVHHAQTSGVASHSSKCNGTSLSVLTASQEIGPTVDSPSPVFLLCNYSWWENEAAEAIDRAEISEAPVDSSVYDSPTAISKGPVFRMSEEKNGQESLEEDASTSPDHSYLDEFQQSSPVSVLDPVYDDAAVLGGKPFDYFDEVRQKLLDSVRRYEMLANMDLDALIKVNEESLYEEFEDDSDVSSFKGSWENESAETSATCHHESSQICSPDYCSLEYNTVYWSTETGVCSDIPYSSVDEAVEDRFYSQLGGAHGLQQSQELAEKGMRNTSEPLDVRAKLKMQSETRMWRAFLDCLNESLDSQFLKGSMKQLSSQSFLTGDSFGDESLCDSAVIESMIYMDLKSSIWNNFDEEVELMGMELEGYLFAVLMQELLSDL
ncbi:hypothetical protein KP509_27G032900 [Ceratopteris richardii]|nr:hypothetical protein KP509_27G032900 [Ceratopteris richardii]